VVDLLYVNIINKGHFANNARDQHYVNMKNRRYTANSVEVVYIIE
jgi:hypothetical protein